MTVAPPRAEKVRLENVSKVYAEQGQMVAALKSVSLRADQGEFVVILGPSGSGKTTLLTLLAGLQRPSAGTVWLFGKRLEAYSDRDLQELRCRSIGMIFQSFHLIDGLTALENVALVLRFAGVHQKRARLRALESLERFGVASRAHAYPPNLSHGEKQRICAARAVVNGTDLIVADEPTAALATGQAMVLMEYLKDCSRVDGACVVLTTHDQRLVKYSDRALTLVDGVLKDA